MHLRERIESGERIAGGRPIEYRVTRGRADRFRYRAEIR
jgi:DNA-binding GntR family transcriptional regulator